MDYLTEGPISQKVISGLIDNLCKRTDVGGHSLFLGQVRADKIKDRKVVAIEYSSYENMLKVEAEEIKKTILSEFGDVKSVDIIHSNGMVNAGEISLLVLVSAGHRHQAILACSKAVELIKEKLPIWKKEIFDDQSMEWRQNILS
jgi:molybdopterin synthase catalytic subunit